MTNEQTDAALEAMLTDLEQARPDTLRERMPAMLALLVLIGRKLLPARTSASDETMPGRGAAARAGAERHAAAPPTYDQYLESLERAGFYVDAREERVQRAYARRMSAGARPDADLRTDPPRPTVRDRVAGATFAEFERTLADKDRSELAETLTRLEAAHHPVAVRDRMIADLREGARVSVDEFCKLAAERLDALGAREAAEKSHTALRSSLQTALGLPANALDAVIIAKVRETGDVLKVAHGQIEEARKVLAAMCDIGVEHDPPLTLPALAERAARRIAVLLEEHQRERTTVDELRAQVAERTKERDAALSAYDRANILIDAVEEWAPAARRDGLIDYEVKLANALERWRATASTPHPFVLRSLYTEARAEADGALREMGEHRERWARIQPLIKALHAWKPRAAHNPLTYESEVLAAFEAWQKAEAAARDAEDAKPTPALRALFGGSPVDGSDPVGALANMPDAPQDPRDLMRRPAGLPRQPDDPGVEPSEPPDTIANMPQQPPTGDGEVVLEYALQLNGLTPRIKRDLSARAGAGLVKYKTLLKTHNGRVALVDAYQEALDAIMYTTQDWIEHKSTGTTQKAVALALRIAEELEARGL